MTEEKRLCETPLGKLIECERRYPDCTKDPKSDNCLFLIIEGENESD